MAICRKSLGGWLVVVACACLGCSEEETGPPTAHLQGAVTINGQPIPADAEASISFNPAALGDARPASGVIADGKFDVKDAPVGKVRVLFNISQSTGKMHSEAGHEAMEYKSLVPKSLLNGQEIEVSGDNPKLDFDLK